MAKRRALYRDTTTGKISEIANVDVVRADHVNEVITASVSVVDQDAIINTATSAIAISLPDLTSADRTRPIQIINASAFDFTINSTSSQLQLPGGSTILRGGKKSSIYLTPAGGKWWPG
jgi:hypothetical protein